MKLKFLEPQSFKIFFYFIKKILAKFIIWVYLACMLNNFQKNLKSFIKQFQNFQTLINAKSAVYFGLATYWLIILFGTFTNI